MKKRAEKIVVSALFTAIIAVISQISFVMPSGVPITLQIFAIALCGYILGVKWALSSVVTYILAGAVGLPVFSGFRGGIQQLFSVTGGFIAGFIVLAVLCGMSANSGRRVAIISGICGLVLCHFVGVLQFSLVSSVGFIESFLVSSLPFLLKDTVLVISAAIISPKLKRNVFRNKI